MTRHHAVFALFMKEDTSQCVYLGLLHIDDGKKDIEMVFETIAKSLKEWGLDVDKCIAFGFDIYVIKQS